MQALDRDTQHLLDQLREEALAVKECFTNFVFQSATAAAVAFGFIVLNVNDAPFVTLTAAPTILVLMIVCRIGVFKFTTANRNLGYQLHLARMESFLRTSTSDEVRSRVHGIMNLDWETLLRAWRVVQVAVFREIYRTPRTRGLWGRLDPRSYLPTAPAQHVMTEYELGSVRSESDHAFGWHSLPSRSEPGCCSPRWQR